MTQPVWLSNLDFLTGRKVNPVEYKELILVQAMFSSFVSCWLDSNKVQNSAENWKIAARTLRIFTRFIVSAELEDQCGMLKTHRNVTQRLQKLTKLQSKKIKLPR
jgi:hypothetical protein